MADYSWLENEEGLAPTEKRGDVGWLQRHAVITGKMNVNEAKLLKTKPAWKKWNTTNPNYAVYAPPDYWCKDDADSKEKQSLVLKLIETSGLKIEAIETQNIQSIRKELYEKGAIPKPEKTPEQKSARRKVEDPPEGFMDDLSDAAKSYEPDEPSDNISIPETDDESEAGPSTPIAKANGKAKKTETPKRSVEKKLIRNPFVEGDQGIYHEEERLNLSAEEVLDLLFKLEIIPRLESESGIFRGEKQIPIESKSLLGFLIKKLNGTSWT
jgi:hypothetical protein